MFYKLLRTLFLVFVTTLCVINFTYADTVLTPQETTIFNMGENLGKISYLISDVLSNDKTIGEAVLKEKLSSLQNLILTESKFDDKLNVSKKIKSLLDKFMKEYESSSKEGKYDQAKLTLANKTFALYTKELSDNLRKYYGAKGVWLYDVAWLSGFTNTSMQSDAANKLMLSNPVLIQNIPYDLPSSIVSALTLLSTLKENQLTPNQVELLKEASQNIITYFNNPKDYMPPVTMKDLVGKWEGRMSAPDGKYYKTSITINTDLTGSLNAEKLFKDPIPLKGLTLTQSAIVFDVKPLNDERLVIRFLGRIVDDMMTGEAIDLSGKKGMWQFLKTTPAVSEQPKEELIKNDNNALNKLLGTWKGKILEESGGISESTVYFNLVGDSYILIKNDNTSKKLKINSIAVNSSGIKFNIQPDDNKLDINFLGKVNGRLIEGNAKANDGTRAYWKMVKVSDELPENIDGFKLNYNYDFNELCDPVVTDNTESVILVAHKKPVSSPNKKIVVPTRTLKEAMYVGYIQFEDGTKAEVKFNYNKTNPEIFIKSSEEESNLPLTLENLKVSDRDISFKTTVNNKEDTAVTFKAKYYDNYIFGKAINSSGKELKWEAISYDLLPALLPHEEDVNKDKIKGIWKGKADFAELIYLPVILNANDSLSTIKIGDAASLSILKIDQKDNNISIEASKDKDSTSVLTFNATLDVDRLKGKINNPDGSSLNVNMELVKTPETKKLLGLWHGKVTSGKYNADVVLNFLSDKRRVFIDDSNAKSGRLELQIKDLLDKDNKVKFKAFSSQTTLPIEVDLDKSGSDFKGFMKNQIKSSQKLNLSLNTSELFDYFSKNKVSKDLEVNKNLDNKVALTETKPVEPKQEDLNLNKSDNETPDNKNVSSEESVETSKTQSESNTTDLKETSQKENVDKPETQASENKEKESSNVDKKPDVETKATKNTDELKNEPKEQTHLFKEDEKLDAAEMKPEENKETEKVLPKEEIAAASVKTSSEEKEKQITEKENETKTDIKQSSDDKTSSVETKTIKIDLKNFIGKWSGELTDPQKEKGEITLDIGDAESYMYVDHSGEKVPFKLFDFNTDGKNISFKIKPSPDIESGIIFSGSLIEGVLSGDALDPNGGKGKWYAKRL